MNNRKLILNKKNSKNNFSIVSYNIEANVLNKINKRTSKLTKDEKKYLKWEYRWNLLKKEFKQLNGDIICINEVQNDVYNNEMKEFFLCKGKKYNGVFTPRLPLKNLDDKKYIKYGKNYDQGNAIFFNINRFRLIETHTINMPRLMREYLKSRNIRITKKIEEKIKPVYGGIIIILEDLLTDKKLCVCDIHLSHKPSYDDLKVLQTHLTIKQIEYITNNGQIPFILTGDFNSTPKSLNYKSIISTKCNNKFNFEIERIGEEPLKPILKTPEKFSKQKLISAYKKVMKKEPLITNYTKNFKDCLDYIFINNKLDVIGALKELPMSYLNKYDSFPNFKNPSDHIPLKIILDYKI